MKVYTTLIVFCVDENSPVNKYVLLYGWQQTEFCLLSQEMKDDSPNGLTLIRGMVYDSMGITGNWPEISPRYVGVIDNPEYIDGDGNRVINIVYSLYMMSKNSTKLGYTWIGLDKLNSIKNISDKDKATIEFAAINI